MNQNDLIFVIPVILLIWAGYLFHSAVTSGSIACWFLAGGEVIFAVVIGVICIYHRKKEKKKGD